MESLVEIWAIPINWVQSFRHISCFSSHYCVNAQVFTQTYKHNRIGKWVTGTPDLPFCSYWLADRLPTLPPHVTVIQTAFLTAGHGKRRKEREKLGAARFNYSHCSALQCDAVAQPSAPFFRAGPVYVVHRLWKCDLTWPVDHSRTRDFCPLLSLQLSRFYGWHMPLEHL